MEDIVLNKITEFIYGDEISKDQRKYTRNKFKPIIDGTESLYIRDKQQSYNFMEGLYHLINDNSLLNQTISQLRKKIKESPTKKDWDWVSQQYQDVLVEIKNVKDECKKEESKIRDEYYMKLKGDLCETKPHQDLLNDYRILRLKYDEKLSELSILDDKYKTLRKNNDDILEEYQELKDHPDKKLRKEIQKEMNKKEDQTKKDLQKQVNNLKKLLKMEQDKYMLLLNTQ